MPGLSEQHVPHKKLLVVDDQQELRRLIALTLHRRFIVDEACDAQEALAAIEAGRPDALILDAMMPGELDGFRLCERIKRSPELADIHVVLVTALGQALAGVVAVVDPDDRVLAEYGSDTSRAIRHARAVSESASRSPRRPK